MWGRDGRQVGQDEDPEVREDREVWESSIFHAADVMPLISHPSSLIIIHPPTLRQRGWDGQDMAAIRRMPSGAGRWGAAL